MRNLLCLPLPTWVSWKIFVCKIGPNIIAWLRGWEKGEKVGFRFHIFQMKEANMAAAQYREVQRQAKFLIFQKCLKT